MAITYKKFFQPTVLTVSAATLFTVDTLPATTLLRGGRVRLTNTTGTAVPVTLYAVPVSGSAGAGNVLFPAAMVVPANNYLDVDLPIMAAGDTLQGLAGTASAIVVHAIAGGLFS